MVLQIIYAPNEIFRKKADPVAKVNSEIKELIDQMFATLSYERAVGIAGNMVGVLKRIIVIDLNENNESKPICMVNPQITHKSDEMQVFEEASLCYPGISAEVARPSKIKVKYLDYEGKQHEIEAEGFFATVIQHEVDYLDGKIYLDHVSKMKRDLLLAKMKKFIKLHPPHVHGTSCSH